MEPPPPALELVGIEKSFGGVCALRGTNLAVRRGEIMGLCGENGAGKSTLLKILSGVYPFGSYTGKVIVGGQERKLRGPADARRAGVAVVHQELTLVPELTVAQNLMLGREPRRFGLVDHEELEAAARRDLARFGFGDRIDVDKPVMQLGIGLQQIVEIVRALPLDTPILVLDEPTAALTGGEVTLLMRWLKTLRERGTTCVYVSHRLDEIFELCDRVTVLRDGCNVTTQVTAQTTPAQVVSAMVGRTIGAYFRVRPSDPPTAAPVLEVKNLGVLRSRGAIAELPPSDRASSIEGANDNDAAHRYVVRDVSFSLRPGEILAVCGAMGSGRTALLSSLFGCARAGLSGEIRIDGVVTKIDSPRAAIRHGLAYVPEDRKGSGLVPDMTVGENLALPSLSSTETMGRGACLGLVDAAAEGALAHKRIRSLGIRGEASIAVSTLSGGNQQKVVVGKWLEKPPKILLLDEPTRGVDIGARQELYAILEDLARRGIAILLASSDLTEVLGLARRILVLRDGRPVAELDGATATEESIVQLSTGATPGPARSDRKTPIARA